MKSINLFLKTLFLFFVGHLFINSHLFASKTLLEELNIECSFQIKTIPPKLEFKGGDFPTEIASSIFKEALSPYPSFLKLVSGLDHEWNNWAYSKLLPYHKLYKAAEEFYLSENNEDNKDIFKRVALDLLFYPNKKLKSAPKETLAIQKILREIISKTVENNIFSAYQKKDRKWSEDPHIIKANPELFPKIFYENKDKLYNSVKLLRAWSELQRYKSGTYVSHMLWETYICFNTFLGSDMNYESHYFKQWNCDKYNTDYVPQALQSIYNYNTYSYEDAFCYEISEGIINQLIDSNIDLYSSLRKLFYTAKKHWKDYPDSKDSLFKIIFQTIDLDKHIMFYLDEKDQEENDHGLQNFYQRCPDYKILTLFQKMPIDFESVDLIESFYKRQKSFKFEDLDLEERELEKIKLGFIRKPDEKDILWEKLYLLKESVLFFAQQHLIPAEIYTRIVQRQLKLG